MSGCGASSSATRSHSRCRGRRGDSASTITVTSSRRGSTRRRLPSTPSVACRFRWST
jgi:hypothetical protein